MLCPFVSTGQTIAGRLAAKVGPCVEYRSVKALHTSCCLSGKRNFRKFPIPNQRTQFEHNKLPARLMNREYDYPVSRDTLHVKYPGFWFRKEFVYVKEMEPQLVVPDLKDFPLKPYVSYRCPDITQTEFTARDLFNATLADAIIEKFKSGQHIDVNVTDEAVNEARNRAKQTGADMFMGTTVHGIQ
ncbi:unnamed protein product [Medioppia subpectinata]|uniref:39S ribosomal protein L41, mitochondrial n=1 Tax=Medioppia subpectinata TaxID=1979941 RepID=A0A7R9PTH6_9ACAR|nr:unnamed protein product [Medioppia subpectinata]CAG2100501.1 unnamed protein product [Medioppia subpectinata]